MSDAPCPLTAPLPVSIAYVGGANGQDVSVLLESDEKESLPPRHDLANLSPTFAWGGRSAGAQQLAVALIAHATGDDAAAKAHYEAFVEEALASPPMPVELHMPRWWIRNWVQHRKEAARQ